MSLIHLSDAAFLFIMQAQMRDLTGFVETRQQLLTLKPNHRMNWIGFAVSHHLNSKYVLILENFMLNLLKKKLLIICFEAIVVGW